MLRTLLPLLLFTASALATELPSHARDAAAHAERRYDDAQVELLAELVRFKTVHEDGIANAENPEFRAFVAHLRERAQEFGFDFTDYGGILVIGLGDGKDRLGIVTHGDVQPADASKWRKSPFELDVTSEPGRLIARGAEDDKAPIATAIHAMKAISDLGAPLNRRIELIVALTEESDWAPFREALTRYAPPAMNIAIDSQYPVVVAEKGFGALRVNFAASDAGGDGAFVESYGGGAFLSQVPEDAHLVLGGVNEELLARLRTRTTGGNDGVTWRLESNGGKVTVHAKGKAAHSSTPEHGINALTHIANLLDGEALRDTATGRALDFVNTLIGTGIYGEQFGGIAYAHSFMGPLTVNLSTVRTTKDGTELAINLRAPAGKSPATLESELREAITAWANVRDIPMPAIEVELNAAYLPEQPSQVEPLLAVFRHYTGMSDARPVSIGGASNAQLMPNAVNFGPSMPGVPYTGHSEHEFITREQMTLNLRMYTAMLALLATESAVSP